MEHKPTIAYVSRQTGRDSPILAVLLTEFECQSWDLAKLAELELTADVDGLVIDANLADPLEIDILRGLIGRIDRSALFVLLTVNNKRALDIRIANALGADDMIPRLDDSALLPPEVTANSFMQSLADVAQAEHRAMVIDKVRRAFTALKTARQSHSSVSATVHAGGDLLYEIFDFARSSVPLVQTQISAKSASIVEGLQQHGIHSWIETVRSYHSQTYQHCLLVTGIAVGFGAHLGCGPRDLQRLAVGGMLHDIGKARIPIGILEKPGPLTDDERIVMQDHPAIGREILEAAGGFEQEMIDVVAHHHEYLDGSGYPDRLKGDAITDLVRIMTICDIFSALIEKRVYKPPMSHAQAYDVLSSMTGKLDMPLVKAFRPFALASETTAGQLRASA